MVMFEFLYILLMVAFIFFSYMIVRKSPAWASAGVFRKGAFIAGIVILAAAGITISSNMFATLKTVPLLVIVAATLFISGTSAAVITELFRVIVPTAQQWTDGMHRNRFLLLWMLLFALQCSGIALLRNLA